MYRLLRPLFRRWKHQTKAWQAQIPVPSIDPWRATRRLACNARATQAEREQATRPSQLGQDAIKTSPETRHSPVEPDRSGPLLVFSVTARSVRQTERSLSNPVAGPKIGTHFISASCTISLVDGPSEARRVFEIVADPHFEQSETRRAKPLCPLQNHPHGHRGGTRVHTSIQVLGASPRGITAATGLGGHARPGASREPLNPLHWTADERSATRAFPCREAVRFRTLEPKPRTPTGGGVFIAGAKATG